jgi:restriction system protein
LRRTSIEIVLVLALAVVVVCIAATQATNGKGKRGERKVSKGLSRLLDDSVYRVVGDVTFPTSTGTTQIDHLVVSPYGVFIIETKNLSGWIFGDENHETWTQVIYKRKNYFYNPIKQNHHHLSAVRRILGLSSDQAHNLVVFTGQCTFKTEMPRNVVLGVRQLSRLIRSRTDRVMSDQEVVRVIAGIAAQRLEPGRDTDRTHVRNVEEYVRRRSTGCPRCGSPMIERASRLTGKRFLGCSQYPRCKGTRPPS